MKIFFFALKLHTAKLGKKQIEIYGEKYYTICIETGSEIRGGIFTEDNIHYNNNNIVEVDCNLISFYPSNDTFCSTISTFNSFRNNNSFHYYIPENLNYYRLKSNEIQSGTISILNKKQETLRLFAGTPTIVKLKFKSVKKINISNLRESNTGQNYSDFVNTNSLFLPSFKYLNSHCR